MKSEETNSVQLRVLNTQNKVHDDSGKKCNGENSRTKTVVETALSSSSNTLCSPVESDNCVDHGAHSDDSE